MYRAFYRKYRPSTFTDVVGQQHITTTLENAVKSGKTSHAYLFTGSRGTGKTSCAKILAKAVNCLNPQNGNPCNECDICKGIESGAVLDIIEIDAASNNGVDNIRDLREEANFTPANAKYRVYIIDEVHMLSIGAFNALLKTLEEPPAHVVFILATTEVHKLPSTILSRCQRFDFKRIPPEDMAVRLKEVAQKEGLSLADDGAMLIARIADGAMRDALSLLDRCSSFEGVIDSAAVASSAGLAGREYIFELCDCILEKNTSKALQVVDKLYNDSCDMERLLTELTSHFRNLMVSKAVKNFEDMIICSQGEIDIIREQGAKTTLATIMSCIDILTAASSTMKQGANRRTSAELCIIRLCTPSLDSDLNAVLRRLNELEMAVASGNTTTSAPAPVKAEAKAEPKPEVKPEVKPQAAPTPEKSAPVEEKTVVSEPPKATPVQKSEAPSPASPIDVPFTAWPEVIETLIAQDPSIIAMLTGSSAFIRQDRFLLIKGSSILETFLKTGNYSKSIRETVQKITGKSYTLGVFNNTKEEAPKSPLEDLVSKAKSLGVNVEEE